MMVGSIAGDLDLGGKGAAVLAGGLKRAVASGLDNVRNII